jgi:hypothetical protein
LGYLFNPSIMTPLAFICLVSSVSSFVIIELDDNFMVPYTIVGGSGERFFWQVNADFPRRELFLVGPSQVQRNISHYGQGTMLIPDYYRHYSLVSSFAGLGWFGNRYMLIQQNRQLIVNPPNPRDFVYGGVLTTTRSLNDSHPRLRVSVSIVDVASQDSILDSRSLEGTTPSHEFTLCTWRDADSVPSSIMMALLQELERLEIQSFPLENRDGSIAMIWIVATDEVLDSLPTIRYHIHTDSGNGILIQLYGRDYVGPVGRDNRRQVLLESVNGGQELFGQATLSKVALFIDPTDKIIGFGEPL